MSFCYFAYFDFTGEPARRVPDGELQALHACLRDIPGLSRALMHRPAPPGTRHPFEHDPAAPALALQLYAERIDTLEAAVRPGAALDALRQSERMPALAAATLTQQLMLVRRFPVDDPGTETAGAERCSYLVHYPGAAEDLNAWLTHYLEHHPQIMRGFAGVREIEIYTRVDWIGGLHGARIDAMQRNKLVFDSPQALSDALLSPVIHDMRADFGQFPPFSGGNVHHPMLTRRL
jgi:hypothetical protein